MDSILTSIKKLLGLTEEYEQFDQDIIIHINSAFFTLRQLGVGIDGFRIEDKSKTWSNFIESSKTNESTLPAIKDYVYLKVRKVFDPPSSSYVMDSINSMIAEYESRIKYDCDK